MYTKRLVVLSLAIIGLLIFLIRQPSLMLAEAAIDVNSSQPSTHDHNLSMTDQVTNSLAVVISEVAWAGTLASADDEWIELYNASDQTIDLSGWSLSIDEGTVISISLSGMIDSEGFYLLERGDDNTISDITADLIYDEDAALEDEGATLILQDEMGIVVDSVNQNGESWVAGNGADTLYGSSYEFCSQERINFELPDSNTNWATNDTSHQNGLDANGHPLNGTPKERNSIIYLEANDQRQGATALTFDSNNQSYNNIELLRAESDQDIFEVEVAEPYTTIVADLTGPDNFDIALHFGYPDSSTLGLEYHLGPHQGLTDTIRFNVATQTGTFYLKVSASPTTYSGEPYKLDIKLQNTVYADVETLIFYNQMRFADTFGIHSASEVMSKLTSLADAPEVKGTIIQLDLYPDVQAAYEIWDDTPISDTLANVKAANMVADTIQNVMIEHLDLGQFPNSQYVVLVGDDQQIPFRRISLNPLHPDLDPAWLYEKDYPFNSAQTATRAALLADQTLTDNNYGSYRFYPYRYLPELAVGRLVQKPNEIVTMIDAFLAHDGEMMLDSGAVAAHGVVADGAEAECDLYSTAAIVMNCGMINTPYTASDLEQAYLADEPALVSNSWRSSHRFLDTPGGDRLEAARIRDTAADLRGHLWNVMGSQSGLLLVDDQNPDNLSLAQALSAKGVTYIANTGWSWGGKYTIALNERLSELLAKQLTGENQLTIGMALLQAKTDYFWESSTTDYRHIYYPQKAITQMTLFGLPMWRYTVPQPAVPSIAAPNGIKASELIRVHPERVKAADWHKSKAEVEMDDSLPLTLGVLELTIDDFIQHQVTISETGSYYAGQDDKIDAIPTLPLLPQEHYLDIQSSLGKGRGVLWVESNYIKQTTHNPVIQTASNLNAEATEEASFNGLHPRYPAVLTRLDYRNDTFSEGLVIRSGQFEGDQNSGELRRFTDMKLLIGFSDSDDLIPPEVGNLSTELESNSLTLSLPISDTSGIYKAYVTYTELNNQSNSAQWQSQELLPDGNDGDYSSTISFTHPITYVIQVMDNAGNVSTLPSAGGATLIGTVGLQARPEPPDPSWKEPLHLSLTRPGELTAAYELVLTSDDEGHFMMTDIEPGSYEIRVKHSQTLQKMELVTLKAGNNHIDFGTLLIGDANNDNMINIIDFSILATTFAICEGDFGFDSRADFNQDDCITIIDFSLLASNFGQMGEAQAWQRGEEGR